MLSLQKQFDLSLECYRGGDVWGAIEILETILTLAPNESQVLHLYGVCLATQGHTLIGEEYIRASLVLNPSIAGSKESLATIQSRRDQARETPYFKQYLLERIRYRKYPRNVAIETVGRCNASCNFCPSPQIERRTQTMSDQLFQKIIGDLRKIPVQHPLNIFPNLVNEPFMDKKFFDRLNVINSELPHATLHLFSNFNVMPRDFFARIQTIRNVRAINVSFNAATRDEYEAVMGIDFERTVNNLKRFMAFQQNQSSIPPVILSRVSDGTSTDAAFDSACRDLFAEFTHGVHYITTIKARTDWLGHVSTTPSPVPSIPCGAWFDINIFCTGVVPHCCMDGHGDHSIGDVNKSSVLEIYNDPVFSHLRELSTSREYVYPCSVCPLMQ